MRLVRGRAEARWFPSRHNAALFRLYAYFRLRNASPEPRNAVLVIDRHQSNVETWLVLLWCVGTAACYLAATVFARWNVALAMLAALPLAFMLIEFPAVLLGLTVAPLWRVLTRTSGNGIAINSFVMMLLLAGASCYFTTQRTWARFVGWQFLVLLALNAIAAVVVFLLRDSIARFEAKVGGEISEP